MSISPTTTPTPVTPTPPKKMLAPLPDLNLKVFGSGMDTPSSGTASLPTPGGGAVQLVPSPDVLDAPLGHHDDQDWFAQCSPYDIQAPGAPLLRDFDSFTEGTGVGSFDSIAAASTDEHGSPIYRLSEARVSLLPFTHYNPIDYVRSWLKTLPSSEDMLTEYLNLPEAAPPALKRPRSSYEEYRPRRPRTRSCPSSRRSSMAPD